MPTYEDLVSMDVEFDEQLLEDLDRFKRRSAHKDRSAVVTVALYRQAEDS